MQYWAHSLPPNHDPPFIHSRDLYSTIDLAKTGHIAWHQFTLSYQVEEGEDVSDIPWKSKMFEVWYRDPQEVLKIQLSNQDFEHEMDFVAKRVFNPHTNNQHYQDFMSGEWAWEQSVCAHLP